MKEKLYEAMALAESLGASAVRINWQHSESSAVGYESGRLKSIGGSEAASYEIDVVVDGRRGAAVGSQPENLLPLTRRAVALAKIGSKAHFTAFPKPAPAYRDIPCYDPDVRALTREKLVDDCGEIVDFLKSQDEGLVVEAGGGIAVSDAISINNAGLYDEYKVSDWNLDAGIQKTTGTDMLSTGVSRGFGQLNSLYDKDYIKNTIIADVRNAARTASIPDGTCPLLIPPNMVHRFLRPVLMGISGKNVFLGTSPIKDRLDQVVFNDAVSILDNPFIPFSSGAANMDDCGIPAQQRLLIDHGRVCTFLYDYDTACLAGATPTGNSGCSPHMALLQPGTRTSQDIKASIKQGLFIKSLLGFGQSNFANGDFSANVELGFAIENGQITGRVKNTMISGNIFDMLATAIQVSADINPCNFQPYLLFPAVNIHSK